MTIEGDGGLVITGAGLEEIRLRPGSYKVHADKDGKKILLEREVVSIAKNGREVVRVKVEAAPVAAKAGAGAFVLLGDKGVEVGKFETLAEAVPRANGGDIIEIRGNGPFFIDPLDIAPKALTIRAGAGYAPVIKLTPAAVKADEGLELHHEGLSEKRGGRNIIGSAAAPLFLTNCKLVVNSGKPYGAYAIGSYGGSSRGRLRNCLIVSAGNAVHLYSAPRTDWEIDNCLIATGEESLGSPVVLLLDEENAPGTRLRLSRNTVVGGVALTVVGPQDAVAERLRGKDAKAVVPALVETEGNICHLHAVLTLNSATAKGVLPVEEQRQFLPKLIQWRERGNIYALKAEPFLGLYATPFVGLLKGLAEWNAFWGLKDTGSVQGTVRLRGNPAEILKTNPEAITVDDFRLRPDSAGHRAGKDGKDLGADVDLVGPGPAYERWKKTPEYQQWLKDTGQLRAEAPNPESKAFVLLGGKGVEIRKFDTLADAVQGTSDGDTIEVSGNGPFVTPPIDAGNIALRGRIRSPQRVWSWNTEYFGMTVAAAGDLNADGFTDLAIPRSEGGYGYVTILLNDVHWPPLPPPISAVRIGDMAVTEGHTGTRAAAFTVSLSIASSQPVTVDYATASGTAAAGTDYQPVAGTLTFAPGETTKTATVMVNGDRAGEPDESFVVNLSNPTNSFIADAQGLATIVDDEPHIGISDVARAEGKQGRTTPFVFTVSLSAAYDQPVTMSFATTDGSARAYSGDYVTRSGTLTFAPGETTKTITIEVKGDSKREYDEYFFVDLSGNSSNSLFTKNYGVGTILNDD